LTGERGAAVEKAILLDKKRAAGTVSYVALTRVGEPSVLSLPALRRSARPAAPATGPDRLNCPLT
jgi:hypothetical protein